MRLTDFTNLNIYVPPKKDIPPSKTTRKIQWDQPNTGERLKCPTCYKGMIKLKWKDLKFWACLNPYCCTEERVPKGSSNDIVPICHVCESDLVWTQEFMGPSINFCCKKCDLAFQI